MAQLHHLAALAPSQAKRLVLEHVQTPTELKPYEILIEVKAVSINPVDWKARDLAIFASAFNPPWPKILGVDAAGVVLSVGRSVTKFKIGDQVAGYVRMNKGNLVGAFQQKVVLWEGIAVRVPPKIRLEYAATLPLAFSTAVTGLRWELQIGLPGEDMPDDKMLKDEPVLILGGAAAIGQFAIQLLRLAGWQNIITTASDANSGLVRGLGATVSIDHRLSHRDIVQRIRQHAGGDIKLVYDVISSKSTQEIAAAVIDKTKGKVALTGSIQAEFPTSVPVMGTFGGKVFDATATEPYNGKFPDHYDLGKQAWTTLQQLLLDGNFRTISVQLIEDGADFAERLETALQMSKAGTLGGSKAVVLL